MNAYKIMSSKLNRNNHQNFQIAKMYVTEWPGSICRYLLYKYGPLMNSNELKTNHQFNQMQSNHVISFTHLNDMHLQWNVIQAARFS
jgi:hypothetical protein